MDRHEELRNFLFNATKGQMIDPERERFKTEWVADYAVRELGATSPKELVDLLNRTARTARERHPRLAFLDAIYAYLREQRGFQDLMEARRA